MPCAILSQRESRRSWKPVWVREMNRPSGRYTRASAHLSQKRSGMPKPESASVRADGQGLRPRTEETTLRARSAATAGSAARQCWHDEHEYGETTENQGGRPVG